MDGYGPSASVDQERADSMNARRTGQTRWPRGDTNRKQGDVTRATTEGVGV